MDETLIHCLDDNSESGDVSFEIDVFGKQTHIEVNIRPYVREMLGRLSKHYEIIVFTASYQCYADKILDYLDPEGTLIVHRIYREQCVVTNENIHIKDLRILTNRSLSNLILVDNSAYSFCL
jgi:CTD small phosphatase-like protein 2